MTREQNGIRALFWLGLIAAGALIHWTGKMDRDDSADGVAADHLTEAGLRNSRGWYSRYEIARDDSSDRETIIRHLSQAATLLKIEADSFGKERDGLRATLPPLVGAAAEAWMRVVTLDSLEIDRLRSSLDKKSGEADSLRSQVVSLWALSHSAAATIDTLTKALVLEHELRTCRIGPRLLSVGCPSRKTAAILGAGAVLVVQGLAKGLIR